ncbi:MAG: hypothetical protein CMG50_01480 [Candidatus Marinimicrobia bacterium]|nr:hypothetical protein [Candidatus Neomarinimicrobiota bacterium]|tara:strand:+ start:6713 stop:7132 length:420 start_codon:yes stop_codon:yes gene_type:complete
MNLVEQSSDFFKNYLRCFKNSIKTFNLTQSQALCLISIPFDGTSQTNLSKRLAIKLSTLSRNLNHLIKMNLIIKEKSQSDVRSYIIKLTPKGQSLYKQVNDNINDSFYKIYSKINIEEKDLIVNILNKINWQFELEYNE